MVELMSGTLSKTGIYRISLGGSWHHCYIGSCADSNGGIAKRWNKHRSDLKLRRHHSIKLQRAWEKHGERLFEFDVLCYCDPEDCLKYEQMALDLFKPRYNVAKVAGSRFGTKQSKTTKDKIRKAAMGRKHTMETKSKMKEQRQGMNSKLTIRQVKEVRRLASSYQTRKNDSIVKTQQQIADRFGVSRSCIKAIVNYETWRSV